MTDDSKMFPDIPPGTKVWWVFIGPDGRNKLPGVVLRMTPKGRYQVEFSLKKVRLISRQNLILRET